MPDTSASTERVVIGIVVGSHGLQGTLKVDPRTDFPERFEVLRTCYLCCGDEDAQIVKIKRCKFAPRGILLTLDGTKTREEADKLRGATIEVPMSDRWALPDDFYYISDLIGCQAVDEAGKMMGEIEQVLRGSQDVLLIKATQGEILVPFVNEWVGKTDVIARVVVIKRAAELITAEEIPPALGESDH
ncbi:MAG: 16S rRNA processing protein RimM [bacterium]|nr:16S rRNA processing protein RimM [bacterium]